MSEPRGQLRKEHLTFPGCSHFRRLDDNHEKCQSCMYGGAPGCTRLSRCHFCADWTSSMWDAEEKNRQAAVKRRIRKKDKKASASSTGEPMRPGYESSSEVFSSRNPSPAHSRMSGYSGKGPSPKVHSRDETRVERGRSPSRGRHGVDEERIELVRSPAKAPRHEVRVERVRSPSPVCHERMEPFCSPSVTRGQERSPGVDTLLDYDEKGLSDDDFIGYDDFPKGFSGSSPEHSCEDDELLASPPRPHLTPLPVDSPKDNPGRVGVICHREEAGSARTLPPGDGKSRGSWTGHQGVATAPGDEDSRGLRRTRGEALPPVDQEGPQRVNQDHVQDMNPVLWNPSTFVDQDGTYFQVMGTNLPTQSVLVPQVPIMNPPAAAAGAPGQQASDPKFTMREFMDLMKFAQSQSVAGQRTSVTPVTGLTRQPAVPQKENLPPAVAGDNYPVESSTEVSASVSKHRSRTRTRGRKHRERRVERSRSPLMTSPLSRLSPSISGETIQYEIGCRDPLRLEVRDGGRRVSIPDGRSHQRKDFSHDSRRNSRSRSRSPLRTESSSRRTSRSARSRRERRHSQSSTSRQRVSDDDGSDIMVSPSRYSIFRNAVRTSRGAYTSVNPRGEGLAKASMVHLSQDDKPEKVAWSVQPQLRHAIDHVSMLAQGVKKIDKVAKTPLCEQWQNLLGDCRASRTLGNGVQLEWESLPPLTRTPISFSTRNTPKDLQTAVDKFLSKGAIEPVFRPETKGFFSRLFLVPKKTGDLRPVIDLSRLNDHLVIPRFKMETQASVRASIKENEWTVSIDIQDAYLHVPMARSVRKYLRFMVNGRVYQFTCLPFGLATSPREFTKLLRPVVQLLRLQGIKLHVYLDDWLIRASSTVQARTHADLVLQVLQHLGWVINFSKSDLVPSQQFDFIGMQFNTCAYTVAPLPRMRVKIQNTLDHWRSHPLISARDLHRLLGMLTFMATLVPRGRLRLRPIQWWASEIWCQETGFWSDRISVTPTILHQVAWWASPAVLQGVSLSALETEITLFTDASSHGWGAQLGSRTLQGTWSPQQASQHINLLEMEAVFLSVTRFLPQLKSRVVRLMCDNAVVVSYINKEGGTKSFRLTRLTIRLLKFCDRKGIRLVPVHLPGSRNIQADALSRVGQTLATEWAINGQLLHPVFSAWGTPVIDLFATFANRKLPVFASPFPDQRAKYVDAMSVPWSGMGMVYVFPPFKMLPAVLNKIRRSHNLSVILIAPRLMSASWMPELLEQSRCPPIPLDGHPLLTQEVRLPRGHVETRHYRPSNLHAWLLWKVCLSSSVTAGA